MVTCQSVHDSAGMDSTPQRESRVLWSFWLACGLAATGAVAPLLLMAGDSARVAGVAIPFGIAALAMAANALTYPRGKWFATALYALAWIAIVYGVLRMIAIPLEVVVIGQCSSAVSACGPGFSNPFSGGESAGIAIGILTGALSLQVGLFGLRALYRAPRRESAAASATANTPPTRVIPTRAVASAPPQSVTAPPDTAPAAPQSVTAPPDSAPAPPPETTAPITAAATPTSNPPEPKPPRKPRAKRKPAPQAELPPPEELLELPASSSPDEPKDTPS